MQRTVVLSLTALVLGTTLLSGCSDSEDANPCGGQPIVYVESDDDETEYHCGSATGSVVPLVLIDVDTRDKAKTTPGKAVPFKPVPKAQQPKPNLNKQPGAGTAPKVNPVKPPAPPVRPPAGKR